MPDPANELQQLREELDSLIPDQDEPGFTFRGRGEQTVPYRHMQR